MPQKCTPFRTGAVKPPIRNAIRAIKNESATQNDIPTAQRNSWVRGSRLLPRIALPEWNRLLQLRSPNIFLCTFCTSCPNVFI